MALQGSLSRNLQELILWNGILQNACSTRPRVVVGLGRSAHSHTVRLMNSRRKGLKRRMTKVVVALLRARYRPISRSIGGNLWTSVFWCTKIGLRISSSFSRADQRLEDLGKHGVYTHFPKDRNFEICKRTKITRAPCRRRKGEAVPRADNFGDLITADHNYRNLDRIDGEPM